MPLRGIRGATTAEEDQPAAILQATRDLLKSVQKANPELRIEDVCSVIFTVTDDLSTTYPAKAVRQMGWSHVPMLCAREIPVPDGLARCIRVLLHWNTNKSQEDIHHVYLKATVSLRPDLNP
jgi:chorismate mutase